MADDKVLFKKGLASSIPEQKDPGSIIIATDTGEMYLDDTSSIRIQIKDSTKLPLSGGTMTGNIDIDNHKIVNVPTPSDDSDAVPKGFVDTAFTTLESEMAESLKGYLPLKGGIMTGSIDMGNQLIKNVETPAESSDAVNKSYVDSLLAFSSVSDMKSADLKTGDTVQTLGFYEKGDGGAAMYSISNTGTADDCLVHELDNGLFATLIINDGYINVLQAGAKGDNVFDNSEILEKVSTNSSCYTLYFPTGTYRVTPKTFSIFSTLSDSSRFMKISLVANKDNTTICGDGPNQSIIKVSDGVNTTYRSLVYVVNANNVTIRDLKFDQNSEHCPLIPEHNVNQPGDPPYTSDGSISTGAPGEDIPGGSSNPTYPHNRNLHKLQCISFGGNIANFRADNCEFRFYGSQAIMGNRPIEGYEVSNCNFIFDPTCIYNDPDTVDMHRTVGPSYDISAVYMAGTEGYVSNCTFTSLAQGQVVDTYVIYDEDGSPNFTNNNVSETPTGQLQLIAATCIECHSTDTQIRNNSIYNYSGLIVSSDVSDYTNVTVSNNAFIDVIGAISLWPNVGYPARNVLISDNYIVLTAKYFNPNVKNPSGSCRGITCNTTGHIDSIIVQNNYISFNKDNMSEYVNTNGIDISFGLSTWVENQINEYIIVKNTFKDMPMYGIYFRNNVGGTQVITNSIIDSNTFINCGWLDSLQVTISSNYMKNNILRRAAIEISPSSIDNLQIINNQIIDNSDYGQCGYAINVANSNWVKNNNLIVKDNEIISYSKAGFATGILNQNDMSTIISNTSQFDQYNIVDSAPDNIVVKTGQVFTNGQIVWKVTAGGGYGRPSNSQSGTLRVYKSTTNSYSTIITMNSESHGIRVGDIIDVTSGGYTSSLTVVMVNGSKVYTTDWRQNGSNTEISSQSATVTIQNDATIDEIDLAEIDTGIYEVPGDIPTTVTEIGSYKVNGKTTVSSGTFTPASGSITIGTQPITLPELQQWDYFIGSQEGMGATISKSQELDLSTLTWFFVSDNNTSSFFGTSTPVPSAYVHSDNVVAEDLLSNTVPVSRVSGSNGVLSGTTTTEGIAFHNSNNLRLRIHKSDMTDAGATSDELIKVAGLQKWITANNAKILYRTTKFNSSISKMPELYSFTGTTSLTGDYSGGSISSAGSISDTQNHSTILTAQINSLDVIDAGSLTYSE